MCRFKSGIILKNRCCISQGEDNSHTMLLEELNIADTTENAITKFVRAELIPDNNEWWKNPDEWKFNVDQDITPDWFDLDKEKYEKEFRETVKEWCNVHIFIDKKVDELNKGFYMLKRCEVKKLCNDVEIMCDSSTVSRMYDSSTVSEMHGSSTVSRMYGSSTVSRMYEGSTVSEMHGSSTVNRMYDSSTVSEMHEGSTVSEMHESSTVSEMCDSSTVSRMYGSSTVSEMHGNSTVSEMYESSTVREMYNNSIARDYENGKIYIASETNLELNFVDFILT